MKIDHLKKSQYIKYESGDVSVLILEILSAIIVPHPFKIRPFSSI